MVECAVVLRVEDLVVEPQTEARSTQSIGPDFCVLAMAAHLMVVPLSGEVRGHARMTPRESVLAIANHLEGLIPFRIARNITMQTHEQR